MMKVSMLVLLRLLLNWYMGLGTNLNSKHEMLNVSAVLLRQESHGYLKTVVCGNYNFQW